MFKFEVIHIGLFNVTVPLFFWLQVCHVCGSTDSGKLGFYHVTQTACIENTFIANICNLDYYIAIGIYTSVLPFQLHLVSSILACGLHSSDHDHEHVGRRGF